MTDDIGLKEQVVFENNSLSKCKYPFCLSLIKMKHNLVFHKTKKLECDLINTVSAYLMVFKIRL